MGAWSPIKKPWLGLASGAGAFRTCQLPGRSVRLTRDHLHGSAARQTIDVHQAAARAHDPPQQTKTPTVGIAGRDGLAPDFADFALVLKKELEERIADLGRKGSWPDILADLDSLTETKVAQDDKCFLLRSPPRPAASLALSATGVVLPPIVRQVNQA